MLKSWEFVEKRGKFRRYSLFTSFVRRVTVRSPRFVHSDRDFWFF